ncbi:hypothetical protein HPB47_018791 [Ixodes persulcatus]|uniref:Uncharacterized protein n=1 Tax=Ixodes persulcatus TaxID=34615 RepID=A0AC60QJU2_IXOPE|nr:hypothetical protein HPB47_018791 [Ixodes persulcatus]
MSTSQPNFRSLITLAEVATRGLTSDPLVPIGDPAASYASRVLSPSQPGAPLIGGRASADGPTRASPFRDGSLLRPEPYAAPIRASVVGSFDATPLGGGADHRHLGVATDQANALPGSHMTTSPVRDGYQVRRPPGHFPMGGNPAAGPSAPLFCGGARSSAQFGASPIRDGALPDGHEAVPLPRDSIPPWPAQSTTPIGVNAAGDLIELPADNVHPPAPCDPAPFRAGASPVSGLEASLFGDGPRAPPVSSAAPLGAGAGSSHDVLLQEAARVIESLTGAMQHRETGQAAANEAGGSTEGWSTWFCSSAVGVPGRWSVQGLARSHYVADHEARRVIVVNIFAVFAVAVGHSGRGSASPRSPWRAENEAVAAVVGVPGWRSTWAPSPGSSWRPRTKSDPEERTLLACPTYSNSGRALGSHLDLPRLHRAPSVLRLKKALGGPETAGAGAGTRPRPLAFPGPHGQRDGFPSARCLPPVSAGGHLLPRLRRTTSPRRRARPVPVPPEPGRRRERRRLRAPARRRPGRTPGRDPVFAAAALAAAGLQGVAVSAPASVPPRPPTPPTEDQAGPSGLQDLIDVDIDLDLL